MPRGSAEFAVELLGKWICPLKGSIEEGEVQRWRPSSIDLNQILEGCDEFRLASRTQPLRVIFPAVGAKSQMFGDQAVDTTWKVNRKLTA